MAIKIAALGASAAGKTSFLAAVVGTEYIADTRFSIRPRPTGEVIASHDANLQNIWNELFQNTGSKRQPEGTRFGGEPTYNLELIHGATHLTTFDWFDYRGTAMGTGNELDQRLRKFLVEASGLIVMLSAAFLREPVGDNLAAVRQRSGLRAAATHLNAVSEMAKKRLPFGMPAVVVVTKADLLYRDVVDGEEPQPCRPIAEMAEDLKSLLPILFEADSGFKTTICLTSLGSNLGEDLSGEGEIKPKNFHIPISYVLHHHFKELVWQQSKVIKKSEEDLEKYQQSLWFSILNTIGLETRSTVMKSSAAAQATLAEGLRRDIGRLEGLLKDQFVYYRGRRTGIAAFQW